MRRIRIRYTLNPNFEPTGENLVEIEGTRITYCYPTFDMAPPGNVQPSLMRYSIYDEKTGKCVQVAEYQIIDIVYEEGWKEAVNEYDEIRMEIHKKIIEGLKEGKEEKEEEHLKDIGGYN